MMDSSANPRRIVVLWFPRLATDRLQRRWKAARTTGAASPESPPLVVVAKVDNALRLCALDRKATALGLSVGMPLANARAMLPELKVMATNEPADRKLLERIADWCDRFTPFVALDGPRGLVLDVTGATHLAGGEQALLGKIRESLRAQGFAVRGALAASAMAARALARYRDGIVIASGEDAGAIAPLPIEALFLDPVTTHAFRRARRFPITGPSAISPNRLSRRTSSAKRSNRLRPLCRIFWRSAAKARALLKPCSSAPTVPCAASPSKPARPRASPRSSNGCSAKSWMRSPIRSIPVSGSTLSGFAQTAPNAPHAKCPISMPM